jgi:hypothetical protein
LEPEQGCVRQRRKMRERGKKNETKVDDVALKLRFHLLRSFKNGPIRGIARTAFVDRDGRGILNMADVALDFDVRPRRCHLFMKSLEVSDSFLPFLQPALKFPDLFCRFRVLPLPLPHFGDVTGVIFREKAMIGNGLRDVVKATLEMAHAAYSDVVLGCPAPVLELGGGVLP